MEARVRTLKEVIDKSLYVVDERDVASAIVLRAMSKSLVPLPAFRPADRELQVRSFRRTREARSFRLCGAPGERRAVH